MSPALLFTASILLFAAITFFQIHLAGVWAANHAEGTERKDIKISQSLNMWRAIWSPMTFIVRLPAIGTAGEVTIENTSTGSKTAIHEPAAFNHPRAILADFFAGQKALMTATKQLGRKPWLHHNIHVIFEVPEPIGGVTAIEKRALQELAMNIGSRKTLIQEQPPSNPGH